MKPFRLLFIVLFAQLMIIPANAQNQFGVVAGLNLANLSADDLNHAAFRFGLGVGGVLDLALFKITASPKPSRFPGPPLQSPTRKTLAAYSV